MSHFRRRICYRASVCVCVCVFRSIRMQFSSRCVFQRTTLNEFNQPDVSRITAYFHAPSMVVSPSVEIDLNAVVGHFNQRVDGFTKLGSGYILECVDRLSASFVKFRPLGIGAGSYIPLPTWLRNKRACKPEKLLGP